MKLIGVIAVAVFSVLPTRAQVVWNFASGNGNPSQTVANLTAGALSAANLSSGSLTFTTSSASSGYSGASGSNNAGVAVKIGVLSASSTYFQFTLAPLPGYQIELTGFSLGSRSTTTGPTRLTLFSSADNYSDALSSASTTNDATWRFVTGSSFSFTAESGTTFRLYGSGGSGSVSAANWRIDDLSLSVSAVPTAIPEPSAFAVLGGAMVLVGTVIRRRIKFAPRPLPAK